MYNMYKASVSPGSVQQILPYLQQPPLLRQSSHLNIEDSAVDPRYIALEMTAQKTPRTLLLHVYSLPWKCVYSTVA
jgi:hypothetical protein